MPGCCAVNCSNRGEQGFRLYKIPSGERNKARRKEWLSRIRRRNFDSKNCRLCEVHFEKDQFERKVPMKLKPNAIPTLFSYNELSKQLPPSEHGTSNLQQFANEMEQDQPSFDYNGITIKHVIMDEILSERGGDKSCGNTTMKVQEYQPDQSEDITEHFLTDEDETSSKSAAKNSCQNEDKNDQPDQQSSEKSERKTDCAATDKIQRKCRRKIIRRQNKKVLSDESSSENRKIITEPEKLLCQQEAIIFQESFNEEAEHSRYDENEFLTELVITEVVHDLPKNVQETHQNFDDPVSLKIGFEFLQKKCVEFAKRNLILETYVHQMQRNPDWNCLENIASLKVHNKFLQDKCAELAKRIRKTETQYYEEQASRNTQLETLEDSVTLNIRIGFLRRRCAEVVKHNQTLETKFSSLLNKDQIDYLKSGEQKADWSNDTMTKAIQLRSVCGQIGYDALLKQGYPLPSEETLQKHLQLIPIASCETVLETKDDEEIKQKNDLLRKNNEV